MGKIEEYRKVLIRLINQTDLDEYLIHESRLPGPRANLELARAVAEEGSLELFRRYLSIDAQAAPYGSALEFLPLCGAIGLGKFLTNSSPEIFEELRSHASDPRWRIREGVAMALQRYGAQNMEGLIREMSKWSQGSPWERRAAIAGLCEPSLLHKPADLRRVLDILDQVTRDIHGETNRKTEGFIALKKALGYAWSVAVAASLKMGQPYLAAWLDDTDQVIQWILKENLKKPRLKKLDLEWSSNSGRGELIAPCGMDCALCVSYQFGKNDLNRQGFGKAYCAGCRPRGKNCTFLKKQCSRLGEGRVEFCFECEDFPCKRLTALDKRYRSKYHMSMIENLKDIKALGMEKFLEVEAEKWRCPKCGGVICCHNGLCLNCDLDKLLANKKYRWGED